MPMIQVEVKIIQNLTYLPFTNPITFQLQNQRYDLDVRPEYARARISSSQGKFYAEIMDIQVK